MNRCPNRQNKGGGVLISLGPQISNLRSDSTSEAVLASKILPNHQKIKSSISFMSAAGLLGPNRVMLYKETLVQAPDYTPLLDMDPDPVLVHWAITISHYAHRASH